jgi:hypothetical protein
MKLLINNKELAYFLCSLINHFEIARGMVKYDRSESWNQLKNIKREIRQHRRWLRKMRNSGEAEQVEAANHAKWSWGKWPGKFEKVLYRELSTYVGKIWEIMDRRRAQYFDLIHNNMDQIVSALGEQRVLNLYKQSKFKYFVKSTGDTIDPCAKYVRRQNFNNYSEDCLIRNTTGNERLLTEKIDRQYPFWFIDSGYTNFLESNKKWHRLVRNHIHHDQMFEAPVDRLANFASFPRPWRESGEKILIIEPGPFAAGIFHVDLKTWKYDVERELKKYTDKKIVFREKAEKKIRTSLIEELNNEDYYCVVNINSNAATEAIWSGIPVITLDRHITTPVSRSKLSDINNLARPHLARWLCAVSYSQFTKDELYDGTAIKILRKYHV